MDIFLNENLDSKKTKHVFFVYKEKYIDKEYNLCTDNPDLDIKILSYKIRYKKKPSKNDEGLIYMGNSISKANAIKEFANINPDKVIPLSEIK